MGLVSLQENWHTCRSLLEEKGPRLSLFLYKMWRYEELLECVYDKDPVAMFGNWLWWCLHISLTIPKTTEQYILNGWIVWCVNCISIRWLLKQQKDPVAGKIIEVPEIKSSWDRLGTSGLAVWEGGGSGWGGEGSRNQILPWSSHLHLCLAILCVVNYWRIYTFLENFKQIKIPKGSLRRCQTENFISKRKDKSIMNPCAPITQLQQLSMHGCLISSTSPYTSVLYRLYWRKSHTSHHFIW